MKFKSLILSIFLIPFTLFGNSTEAQLTELKFKKGMELSVLGNKISEKDKHLRSLRNDAMQFLAKIWESKEFTKEQMEEEGKAVDDTLNLFYNALLDAITNRKNIIGFYSTELFKTNIANDVDKFDTMRFFVIQTFNETNLLKMLIEQYETLQQELIFIDQELNNLRNN